MINNQKPLVSINIPYYNDIRFLRESIDSVLNQTYENFELILLDHASTDGSRELAHSYKDKRIKQIKLDRNEGAGGGLLLKEFMKKSKGKYIKPFCADDIMLPNCIEELVEYLEGNPDKDFAFANMEYINAKGKSKKKNWLKKGKIFNTNEVSLLKDMLKGANPFPFPTSMIKKDIIDIDNISNSMIIMFDGSLWASFLSDNKKVGFVNKILVKYRQGDQQISSKKNTITNYNRRRFETFNYNKVFYTIKDPDLINKLFPKNPYSKMLKTATEKDLKFILSYNFLQTNKGINSILGYIYISDLLNDGKEAKILMDKFKFGILEFRNLYSKNTSKLPFKKRRLNKKWAKWWY